MYTIGYFVYGINLMNAEVNDEDNWEFIVDTYCQQRYSGGGDPPVYCGVDVGQIDEADDYPWEYLQAIHDKVDASVIAAFEKKRDDALADPDFPEEAREFFMQEPKLFLTWGTS